MGDPIQNNTTTLTLSHKLRNTVINIVWLYNHFNDRSQVGYGTAQFCNSKITLMKGSVNNADCLYSKSHDEEAGVGDFFSHVEHRRGRGVPFIGRIDPAFSYQHAATTD